MTEPGPAPREEPLVVTPEMLAGVEDAAEEATGTSDGREDFEAGIRYLPPITLALIVLNAGMFVWQLSVGALDNEATIVAFGALSRERVLDGEWWRLASASVLHGSAGHIASNVVSLYVIGIGLEHAVGGPRLAMVYLICGVGASLASVLSHATPSVGASGAIFGMMGAVIVFLVRHRERYEVRDKRVPLVVAVWAGVTVLIGIGIPFIDNAAHVGGLIAGMLVGLVLEPARQARSASASFA